MITNYLCNVTTNSYLLLAYLTVLLNLLTYWRKFHFLFIILYVLPKSCSFMHLTTLVSISVSVSLSYGLINIPEPSLREDEWRRAMRRWTTYNDDDVRRQ